MNLLYYLGAIVANVGVASLAILLVLIRNRVPDPVKQSDWETLAALIAFAFLFSGIVLQVIGLFEVVRV
jgi:hypothetical protein